MKKYALAAVTAFALSALFTRLLLPFLRKLKIGQNILSYVKEHEKKAGTPTMGGLAFVFAAVLCACVFVGRADKQFVAAVCLGLAYAAVGFLDDAIKIRYRQNMGLRPYQKIIFQLAAALLAGIFCCKNGIVRQNLPFSSRSLNFGTWTIAFSAFTFLALVNAVNLTDGLDSLAGGVSVAYFISFGILIVLQNKNEPSSLALLSFILAAAIVGFLLFNAYPASIFMGDTGSLSIGGFASSVATFSQNALYIPPIGVCFVCSVISVIVQVIYYKASKGKRVFLMSPLHHHFQKKGYSESKIATAYTAVTAAIGLLCIAFA